MTKQTAIKIAIFAALVIAFVLLYPYIKEYASLEFIKQKRIEFQEYYQDNKVLVLSVFFVGYVAGDGLVFARSGDYDLVSRRFVWIGGGRYFGFFCQQYRRNTGFFGGIDFCSENPYRKNTATSLKKSTRAWRKKASFICLPCV